MPADDLVLNVRQIAQYPAYGAAPPAASLLMQTAGFGSAYASISPAALVGTALSTGGDMTIGGGVSALSFQGGAAQFSNAAVNMLAAQKACFRELGADFGSIAGVPIATTAFASGLVAALQASTVWSFMGRRGDVRLWIQDILAAGGAPIFSPRFMGAPMADTPGPQSCNTRLATTAFVHGTAARYVCGLLNDHPFVFSFNGRTGDVVLTAQDVIDAGATLAYAPLDSPAFTGYPTAPTAPPGSQTAQLATTAFVMNAVQESTTGVASFNGRTGIVALSGADVTNAGGALLASPSFSGTPTAPTAAPGTDTAQLATCQWVINELGGVTSGVTSFNGRAGAVVQTLADITGVGGAPLASPAFNGVPTAPTAATNTSTQQLATTAFVMTAVTAGSVTSFNGRTGSVTLTANDLSAASGVTNPSASLTGTPTAPTAAPGTNSTQLATCAFVAAAIGAAPGVASFNTRTGAVTLSNADVIAVLPASGAAPLVNGTASAGTATGWSRGDHVHPTDTSRYSASNPSGFQTASQVASALAAYLPLSGGTVSGGVVFQGYVAVADGNNSIFGTSNNYVGIVGSNGFGGPGSGAIILNGGGRVTYAVEFYGASNRIASIDGAGNFAINGVGAMPGGGPWASSSDARIKDVQGDYRLGLEEVLKLAPVRFRYKGNDARLGEPSPEASILDRVFVGLVAQAVETIMPGMVTKTSGFVDGEPVDDLRILNTNELIYAVVNAIKTLAARLDALEAAT